MVPALLMRMSMRPNFALTWVKRSSAPVVEERSARKAGGFGADGGGGFGGGAAVAVAGDGGSGLRKGGGDGRAEAAGGAGNESNFVVEAEEVNALGEVFCMTNANVRGGAAAGATSERSAA